MKADGCWLVGQSAILGRYDYKDLFLWLKWNLRFSSDGPSVPLFLFSITSSFRLVSPVQSYPSATTTKAGDELWFKNEKKA